MELENIPKATHLIEDLIKHDKSLKFLDQLFSRPGNCKIAEIRFSVTITVGEKTETKAVLLPVNDLIKGRDSRLLRHLHTFIEASKQDVVSAIKDIT